MGNAILILNHYPLIRRRQFKRLFYTNTKNLFYLQISRIFVPSF
jgi:hypothetical protein